MTTVEAINQIQPLSDQQKLAVEKIAKNELSKLSSSLRDEFIAICLQINLVFSEELYADFLVNKKKFGRGDKYINAIKPKLPVISSIKSRKSKGANVYMISTDTNDIVARWLSQNPNLLPDSTFDGIYTTSNFKLLKSETLYKDILAHPDLLKKPSPTLAMWALLKGLKSKSELTIKQRLALATVDKLITFIGDNISEDYHCAIKLEELLNKYRDEAGLPPIKINYIQQQEEDALEQDLNQYINIQKNNKDEKNIRNNIARQIRSLREYSGSEQAIFDILSDYRKSKLNEYIIGLNNEVDFKNLVENGQNIYLVHVITGIRNDQKKSSKKVTNPSLQTQDEITPKMRIENAQKGYSMSFSTVKNGDSDNDLWSNFGLVYSQAKIVEAYQQDIKSIAHTMKQEQNIQKMNI